MTTKTKFKYGVQLNLWWELDKESFTATVSLRGLWHDGGRIRNGFGGGLDKCEFRMLGSAKQAITNPETLGFYRGEWGLSTFAANHIGGYELKEAMKSITACDRRSMRNQDKLGVPKTAEQILLRAMHDSGASHFHISPFSGDDREDWCAMKHLLAMDVNSLVYKHRQRLISKSPEHYRAICGQEQPEDFQPVTL